MVQMVGGQQLVVNTQRSRVSSCSFRISGCSCSQKKINNLLPFLAASLCYFGPLRPTMRSCTLLVPSVLFRYTAQVESLSFTEVIRRVDLCALRVSRRFGRLEIFGATARSDRQGITVQQDPKRPKIQRLNSFFRFRMTTSAALQQQPLPRMCHNRDSPSLSVWRCWFGAHSLLSSFPQMPKHCKGGEHATQPSFDKICICI
jgi:hypothetical protein